MSAQGFAGPAGGSAEVVGGPAKVVFAVLVLASFAAFGITQHLKHTPTAVQRFMMTPNFSPTGRHRQERISFRIRQNDEVTVSIVDANLENVATLAHDLPLARYTQLSLRWNGRRGPTAHGRMAPKGEYRVQVSLRRQHHVVLSPRSFELR